MDCSPIHGRLWRAELLSALPSALLFWSSSSPPVREASECVRNSRCCGVLHVKSRPRVLGGLTVRAALRGARGIRKMLECIFAQKLVFTRTRARSGENNFYANDPWIRTVCALP